MDLFIENFLRSTKHRIAFTQLDNEANVDITVIKENYDTKKIEHITFTMDVDDIDRLIIFMRDQYNKNNLDWPLD